MSLHLNVCGSLNINTFKKKTVKNITNNQCNLNADASEIFWKLGVANVDFGEQCSFIMSNGFFKIMWIIATDMKLKKWMNENEL